jgi:acetylornithine deacetylase
MKEMKNMTPFELTRQLMLIPSVTGNEAEVGRFLASFLEGRGYRVETQPVSEDRFNVLAFEGEPDIVFCTHIDTVPPFLPVSEDDNSLYGRGACDTKGIIAAMIEAGERLRRGGISNFAYLLVVGEETGGDGAKMANTREWDSRYVIVGEPTENKLARAQKGTLLADLKVSGRAAHSGYPAMGIAATDPLIHVLHDCILADWGKDPTLGVGTFNPGVLRAGERANILAPEAMATVMLRTVEDREAAEKRLRSVVAGRADIAIHSAADPQFMHVEEGFPETVVSFGSDVPYLGNLGKPILVGPGSILAAHTANEKIDRQDLLDGIDLYENLVRRLVL